MEYKTLSISAISNTDGSIVEDTKTLPAGPQTYHGLPFEIGNGAGKVAGFGQGIRMEPVTVKVGASPRHLIFAHRLLDTDLYEGGTPIGVACADYVFVYANGDEVRVPIRERLEIGTIPTLWGHFPLLAKPDRKDEMHDRDEGPFSQTGWRQTEAIQKWPRDFFLWYWTNPGPGHEIESIRIEPKGPRFYIGGITLSNLEEPPLVKAAKRPVTISVDESLELEGNLEVEVDRGVATYPYPLPEQTAEEFLKDPRPGWGQERNRRPHRSYVEIAANPSATVSVKHQEKILDQVNWGEVESKGKVESEKRVRVELVDPGRNWVKVKVVDSETDEVLPCRVHFRSRDGIPYAPHGHHPHVFGDQWSWHVDIGGDVRLGQITYAYIDGRCEGWLPRGEVLVDIARGFEYEPLRAKVKIEPGQQELTLRLEKAMDLNAERYFSGDTHVHFLSTQGAQLEAAAEGVNVINLLQSQWGHLFTNTEEFTGEPSVSRNGKTIVYATQENRQHLLGHLTLLGLKKPIMPWCSDGPGEAEMGGNLETTLCRWADACREQGGTVVIPHIPTPNGEPPALIATGRADAVEFLVHKQYEHREYYRYLNCGYKLPLVGGTDKMSSEVPVGLYRTYVHIPEGEEFNYDNWCKYMKAGNTFHSGGPILRLQVEGKPIGTTIDLPSGGGTVEVTAEARSVIPFHSLEIVLNGEVVDRVEESGGAKQLSLASKLKVEKHSWVCARCGGPGYGDLPHHDEWRRDVMAHTSPVYIAVGEPWWMFDLDTANYMLTLLNGGIDYIRTRSPQWKPGTVTHHHGHEDHLAFLEEPFREAISAIHKRMHDLGIPH